MRHDWERLHDILEAIARIERYVQQGRDVFDHDELVQVWIIHHIQVIGEAVRHLSDALRAKHADLPWAQIIGMRNILVHDYFGIDLEAVWSTVVQDLPDLRRQMEAILREVDRPPD